MYIQNDLIYIVAPPQIYDHIKSVLQYSLVQGLSVFHSCMRRSHPSQINSLGSIQVTWQLLQFHQPMETTHCFCVHLITHIYNTLSYIQYYLKSGRSMVVGHVLMVHTCSFMCINHINMITHLIFYKLGSILSSELLSCKQRMAGILKNDQMAVMVSLHIPSCTNMTS